MSQHGGSSMMSSDNPENKYKKALKEISKLINTNKQIRQQSEDMRRTMQNQMNQFALRYNDLEKENHELKKEHQSMEKYLEQLQQSNTELQREHHTAEKELAYLNEMLAEQNAQLKKVQAIKDQKKITQLIRTYEEKQHLYHTERGSHEELIRKLRQELSRLQFQANQERAVRQQIEDKFQLMKAEINQFRQLNALLIQKNQKVFADFYNKEGVVQQKERQIQGLVQELRKQISNLKVAKESAAQKIGAQYESNYEIILEEKNKILAEYVQLKEQYQVAQNKIRDMYDLEERMKGSVARAETLAEQCNMLKSKIVVLQSRQVMDDGVDFQFNNKEFDDKISHLLSQGDPLIGIKNSDETSHFKILKAYIVELRQKLQKVHLERKESVRKYKSVNSKFTKMVEDTAHYEQENKILLGKVQGFQKLTEKLQNQLERNMMIHQSQVTKITNTASEMITRKDQELQASVRFMRQQIEQIQDRSAKTEKNLLQQVEFLKLQVSALSIRNEQIGEKLTETNEFIIIYKKKLFDFTELNQDLEDKNAELNEDLIKFQQLYKDEKTKTEGLATQKNQLSSKIAESNDELDRKVSSYEDNIRLKSQSFEVEIKRYKSENTRLIQQVQSLRKEVISNRREFQQKKYRQANEIQQLKKELNYFRDIQNQYNSEKLKNREIQTQNETLKIKNARYSSEHQKATQLEDQLMRKTDQYNDIKRKLINVESALSVAQSDFKEEKIQTENLRKENSQMRMKLLESGHQIRKQFDSKDQDARQTILRLNEEISELNLQLNEEKGKNSRLNSDYHRFKSQKNRMEQFCEELREKDSKNSDTINGLKGRVQQAIDEMEKGKAQNRMLQLSVKRLNDEIDNLQNSYSTVRQELSSLRIKEQESENIKSEMVSELQSMKFYFNDVEEHIKKGKMQVDLSWQDQKARGNMHEIIMKIKKLLKTGQHLDSRSNLGGATSAYAGNIAGLTSYSNAGSGTNVYSATSNVRREYTTTSMMLSTENQGTSNYNFGDSSATYGQGPPFNSRQTGQSTTKQHFDSYAEQSFNR